MTLAVWCAIAGVLCIVGALLCAVLGAANEQREHDEHEQGGP